jgi:hypothetical protein
MGHGKTSSWINVCLVKGLKVWLKQFIFVLQLLKGIILWFMWIERNDLVFNKKNGLNIKLNLLCVAFFHGLWEMDLERDFI